MRLTAAYRVTPRMQAGVEWNPNAHEAGFIGNYVLAPEAADSPMISLGTSSDRIGTPPGPRAWYITFAKALPGTSLAPYASLNYSGYDRRANFPFGVNWKATPNLGLMYMNDGSKSHLLMTYSGDRWSVTGMLVWLKRPGISVSFSF